MYGNYATVRQENGKLKEQRGKGKTNNQLVCLFIRVNPRNPCSL